MKRNNIFMWAYISFIVISQNFIYRAKENINEDLAFISKVEEKTKLLELEGKDISSIHNSFMPIKLKVEEMNSILEMFERKLNKTKRTKNISEKMTLIFAYLGFLCLLSLMILLSYIDVPILMQEIVTVFPFAVILITKRVSEWANERLKEEMANSQEVIEKYDIARSKLIEANEKFEYLLNLVETSVVD